MSGQKPSAENHNIIFRANFLMLKNSYLGILELLYL